MVACPVKIVTLFCNIFTEGESDRIAMNDAELVEQILNGNNNAFRFLVAKHERLVLHVVGRIIQRSDEVEDVCQDVFIKVFRKLKGYKGDARLSTWIAAIAYNTSISLVRKKARQPEQSYDEQPGLIFTERDPALNQQLVERDEVKAYLLKMIEQLPLHYRTVLTLFHLEEFSYKEIEQITGMPEGTIKSYLSRARRLLKEKLEQVAEKEKTNIFADYVER
jgi:RNA polymerase sigma factor (sigma-70 family)